MVDQQTLKNIRNNLNSSFSIFRLPSQISTFVEREMQKQFFFSWHYTDDRCLFVYKKAVEYLEAEVNKIYNEIAGQINEYIDDLNKTFETNCLYGSSDADALTHIAVGAGAGLAAAILLSGPIGWFVAIGSVAGAVVNSNKKKQELISKIKKDADTLNGEAIKKLAEVLDLYIVDDALLSVPEQALQPIVSVDDNDNLTKEQIEIKHFLEEREIKYLVHFTDECNIDSIRKNGICSPKEGRKKGIKIVVNNNEQKSAHKAEKYMKSTPDDYISLTITTMNEKVLSKFKYEHKIKHAERILIDASILWKDIDKDRIYCNMNASARSLSCGNNLDAFRAMFAQRVEQMNYDSIKTIDNREGKPKNVATHKQAEILFQSNVDPKYLYFGNNKLIKNNVNEDDCSSSDLDFDDLPF